MCDEPEPRPRPGGAAVRTGQREFEAGLFFDGVCWGSGGVNGDRDGGCSGAGRRSGYLELSYGGRGKDAVAGDTLSGG